MTTFNEVVSAVDSLSIDKQQTLVELLRRRIASLNREVLVRDVADARAEHKRGQTRNVTVDDLMDEVRSEP